MSVKNQNVIALRAKISIGTWIKSKTGAHTMVSTKKETEHGLGLRLAPSLTLELGVWM